METNKKDRSVLNDLIKINEDRIQGYEKAIKETQGIDDDLRETFRRMVTDSQEYKQELTKLVNELGGDAATEPTIPGEIYRVWMDVKTTASGNSRESVLSACEFGEDAAQKAYKKALDRDDLSSSVRAIVTRQRASLKTAHDLIRNWRDREAEKGRGKEKRTTAF